ncbi:MAG: hypothetical protein M3020_17185 [Myxococcota bacterium]|nr:hypothetical protein [Myxococcota bacterium]
MKQIARSALFALGLHFLSGCAVSADGMDTESSADSEQALRNTGQGPIVIGGGGVFEPVDPDPLPPLPPPPPPPPSVSSIVAGFQSYDINGDGIREIESLSFLAGEETNPNASQGRVLVLYDPRLTSDDPSNGVSGLQMRLQLALLRSDLFKENYQTHFIETKLYRGAVHQDGRTLLALRRMIKAIHQRYPLKAVMLIGDFPESTIVRRVFVRSHIGPEPRQIGSQTYSNIDFAESGTEVVAPRSDLILSDLDGNWENVYRQESMTYRDVTLVPELPAGGDFPVAGQTLTSSSYELRNTTVSDYFLVDDQSTSFREASGKIYLTIDSLNEPGPELSSADQALPNPIARPEIDVSRVNARHIALNPSLVYNRSTDGQGLFGSDGKPRLVRLTGYDYVQWKEDPTLERRVIADYLYRNHAFRLGGDRNKVFRTSAVRALDSGLMSPTSFNTLLKKADSTFGTSLSVDDADLAEYLNWLKEPAVLRGIAAHSNEAVAQYGASNAWLINAQVGGKPWSWNLRTDATGYYLEASLGQGPNFDMRSDADFYVYRTLWENKIFDTMATGQTFYIHDGCTVNGAFPINAPYSTPNYAARQHAESMLFYANGLGMAARAKVFNDTPRKFTETIATAKRFAAGLSGYYTADASDAALNPNGASNWPDRRTRTLQRKRTYFWGLLGDPTLRIKY